MCPSYFRWLYRVVLFLFQVSIAAQKIFRGKQGRLKARRELLQKCAAVEVRRCVSPAHVFRFARPESSRYFENLALLLIYLSIHLKWLSKWHAI